MDERPSHPDAAPPYRQPKGVGPNGRPLCRWCWGECPKGRTAWCSPACVHSYRVGHDWNYCKWLVLQRDRGVCAMCGTDAEWLGTAIDALGRAGLGWCERGRMWRRLLGCTRPHRGWEADHVIAKSEGGPDHPDNLRTLCVPCHKARTAEQRARWAAQKRDARAELFVGRVQALYAE